MPRPPSLVWSTAIGLLALAGSMGTAMPAQAAQTLVAAKVDHAPEIDGMANDPAWQEAAPLITRDDVAAIEITLRAVYTDDSVFILVTFPDPTESRGHKSMLWVPEQARYRLGPDREDTFVFKWSMEPVPVDLGVTADHPYRADIWYWKAHRTDPSGHADDKMHVYSALESPDATRVLSERGMPFFLARPGDAGGAAYATIVQESRVHDTMPSYVHTRPEGSRADVRARGRWQDGRWTVEFARKLTTGQADDVQFDLEGSHQFGVSRFEIAGRRPSPQIDEPRFGAGDIGEDLTFQFRTPG